jgi:hypothetical protein
MMPEEESCNVNLFSKIKGTPSRPSREDPEDSEEPS